MSIVLINVADTQDPNDDQGRSYRDGIVIGNIHQNPELLK
jgi:hypothetical protein